MAEQPRVALITGCGKRMGIGAACARALASAGNIVVVSDVQMAGVSNAHGPGAKATAEWQGLESLVDDINRTGGRASWIRGDVSVEADAKRMRGGQPFVFTNLMKNENLSSVIGWIQKYGLLEESDEPAALIR